MPLSKVSTNANRILWVRYTRTDPTWPEQCIAEILVKPCIYLKTNSAGIPQRRQRPVDDEGEPVSHVQLGEGQYNAPHSQRLAASPLCFSSIPSTVHVSLNKRCQLGNSEDDEGQPNSTPSVVDHVSPQNLQSCQSQEGGSDCGPRIDSGEDVTRINIDDDKMEFVDTGHRNEYDVRTTTNI
jgi:hypothetical protein